MTCNTARVPYARAVVLLPSAPKYADWFCTSRAFAEFICRTGMTVGFSADDAAIGCGLERMFVYAVNPGEIGTGLTKAWYGSHYPNAGVVFNAIEAGSPDEFVLKFTGA